MEESTIVKMTPNAGTSSGYMKVKEKFSGDVLRFLTDDQEFRGRLMRLSWFQDGNLIGSVRRGEHEFNVISQVGMRPEIRIPGDWFDDKIITNFGVLSLKFEFQTSRQEATWYAYLSIKLPAGDTNAQYLVNKHQYEKPWDNPDCDGDHSNPSQPKPPSGSGCGCDIEDENGHLPGHEEVTTEEIDNIFSDVSNRDIDNVI